MTINYNRYKGFQEEGSDQSVLLDARQARKTETLFLESISTRSKEKYDPIYTLREQEKQGLPSAYQIYMHSVDESDAALKLVGSLSHWRRLCKLKWFMEGSEEMGHEGLRQWREDMKARDATTAKRQLMAQAAGGNVSAAKKLYDDSAKKPVGRPKKQQPEDTERDDKISQLHSRLFGKD